MGYLRLLWVVSFAFLFAGTGRGASADHAGAPNAKPAEAAVRKPVSLVAQLAASSPEVRRLAYTAIAKLTEPELEALRIQLSQDNGKLWNDLKGNLIADLDVRRYETREAAHKAISLLGCLAQTELEKFQDKGPEEIQRRGRRLLDEFYLRLAVHPYEALQLNWVQMLHKSDAVKKAAEVIEKIEKALPRNWAKVAEENRRKVEEAEQGYRNTPPPTDENDVQGAIAFASAVDKMTQAMANQVSLFSTAAKKAGVTLQFDPSERGPAQLPLATLGTPEQPIRLDVLGGKLRVTPLTPVKLTYDSIPHRIRNQGCEGETKLENGVPLTQLKKTQISVTPALVLHPDRPGTYELQTSLHEVEVPGDQSAMAPVEPPPMIIDFTYLEAFTGVLPKVTNPSTPAPPQIEKLRWVTTSR